MTVADRIKARRESLGMTQTDLAKKLGYTGKSSISKIESSGDNVSTKKIYKLAPALRTTRFYLLGWITDPDISLEEAIEQEKYGKVPKAVKVIQIEIDAEEQSIIEMYRSLNKAGKEEAKKRIMEMTQLPMYTEKGETSSDSTDEAV